MKKHRGNEGFKAVVAAEFSERCDVAAVLEAEAEVLADGDPATVEPLGENRARKFRRGKTRGGGVKGEHVDVLNSAGENTRDFVPERRNSGEVRRPEKFLRVRFKRDDGGREGADARRLAHFGQKRLVAAVYPVEITDGDRAVAAFEGRGQTPDDTHE